MVTYTTYSNVSETVSLIFNSASIENIRVYVSIYVPEYIHRHTVYLHIAGVEFFDI